MKRFVNVIGGILIIFAVMPFVSWWFMGWISYEKMLDIYTLPLQIFSEKNTEFLTDKENLIQSLRLVDEAFTLTKPPENTEGKSFELSDENQNEFELKILKGLELAKKVTDEYLDYLHPEFKAMFKEKFMNGTEMYYEGWKAQGLTLRDIEKQMEGVRLRSEWANWLENAAPILDKKVFAE